MIIFISIPQNHMLYEEIVKNYPSEQPTSFISGLLYMVKTSRSFVCLSPSVRLSVCLSVCTYVRMSV